MKLRPVAALLLVLVACGRPDRPEATAPQTVSPTPSASAWTWHPLGGLAVVEGEVLEPTNLILEGRSIRERRFAEPGPVRWEFFRPPEGEAAVLRTAEGRELARFTFALAAPRPKPSPASPRLARRPEPTRAATPDPAGRPLPEPLAPKTRAEARLPNLPMTSIPGRKPFALPSASEAPTQVLRRPSVHIPILADPVTPPPFAKPLSPGPSA